MHEIKNNEHEKALFVIGSPLQYVNSLELIHHLGLKAENCFIAIGRSLKNPTSLEQIQNLAKDDIWGEIYVMEGWPPPREEMLDNSISEFYRKISAAREFSRSSKQFLKRIGKVDNVVIGDYRSHVFRHFAYHNKNSKIWLIDDGSATHQIVKHRTDSSRKDVYKKMFVEWDNKTKYLHFLGNMKYYNIPKLNFFSCYDFQCPDGDTYIKNEYNYFTKKFGNIKECDEIWLLGANHVENNFTDLRRYMFIMEKIASYFKGEKIKYFAHRGEREDKIDRLQELGFEIFNNNIPIEVYIGQKQKYPKALVGIASSAIDNLSNILKEDLKVYCFDFERDYTSKGRYKHLKDIVDYHYKNKNVKVISTNNSIEYQYKIEQGKTMNTHNIIDKDFKNIEFSQANSVIYSKDKLTTGFDISKSKITKSKGIKKILLSNIGSERNYTKGDNILIESFDGKSSITGEVVTYNSETGELRFRLENFTGDLIKGSYAIYNFSNLFEFHPTTENRNLGLLLENGSKNLLINSNDFSSDSYVINGMLPFFNGSFLNNNFKKSPTGDFDSSILTESPQKVGHSISQTVKHKGKDFTFSGFIMPSGKKYIQARVSSVDSKGKEKAMFYSIFDITKGTVVERKSSGNSKSYDSLVLQHSNNWSRFYVSGSFNSNTAYVKVEIQFFDNNNSKKALYKSTGKDGICLWGLQLEPSKDISSYIPTFGVERQRETRTASINLPKETKSFVVKLTNTQKLTNGNILEISSNCKESIIFSINNQELTLSINKKATDIFSFSKKKRYNNLNLALVIENNLLTVIVNGNFVHRCYISNISSLKKCSLSNCHLISYMESENVQSLESLKLLTYDESAKSLLKPKFEKTKSVKANTRKINTSPAYIRKTRKLLLHPSQFFIDYKKKRQNKN